MTTPTTATATIAEDLLLLLFDPSSGSFRGEGTPLFNVLAGAALVDLAFDQRVELVDAGMLRGKQVRTLPGDPPADPLLRSVWDRIAERPLEVHALIAVIGPTLREPVIDRLVERGHLRRDERRMLGFIPMTALAPADTARRDQLVAAVRPVLAEGTDPDRRTAALAALLSASDSLPAMDADIPWSGAVYTNGKRLERGEWGSAAAAEVVARAAAALVAASFVISIAPNLAND